MINTLDDVSVDDRVGALLAAFPPAATDPRAFLEARFDHGLAWVDRPVGEGGLGAEPVLNDMVARRLAEAGAPDPRERNLIGVDMLVPTLLEYGTPEQLERWVRPAFTGAQIWCQLFSEPGAGSDLASLSTRARRDGDVWIVNGQKVWTTLAHLADRALCIVRTGSPEERHRGLTMLAVDMHHAGVDVRPLRQISGDTEYNEVFLTDVVVSDRDRIGPEGDGWRVATATLSSERHVVSEMAQGAAMAALRDRLMRAWTGADPVRRTNTRRAAVATLLAESMVIRVAAQRPELPPSVVKVLYGEFAQRLSSVCLELAGPAGALIDTYAMTAPTTFTQVGGGSDVTMDPAKGLLVSLALTIAGGTTNINKNVLAERVLGLPPEPRRTA